MSGDCKEGGSAPVCFILDRPAHPGNIGAVARALKNTGFSDLRLISPRLFPHQEAVDFAVGAADLLETAQVFATLDEALADCHLVVATTARPRGHRRPVYSPRELAARLTAFPASSGNRVALLFGTEFAGLETRDVNRSHWICDIPTAPSFRSLNLSQAVLLVSYELMLTRQQGTTHGFDPWRQGRLAESPEMERFFEHLEGVLNEIQFLLPGHDRHMMASLRALFLRAGLDSREVRILRGVLNEVLASRDRKLRELLARSPGDER